MNSQVFGVGDIPFSLWDSAHERGKGALPKGKLRLPARLEQAYQQVLEELDLVAMASDTRSRDSGPIGEQGEAGAHEHFAKRFSGSCGRIQMFTLDPHNTFKTPRLALATIFSGGKVRLLDIPLGAGAAAIEILCLVGQLVGAVSWGFTPGFNMVGFQPEFTLAIFQTPHQTPPV